MSGAAARTGHLSRKDRKTIVKIGGERLKKSRKINHYAKKNTIILRVQEVING